METSFRANSDHVRLGKSDISAAEFLFRVLLGSIPREFTSSIQPETVPVLSRKKC